MPTDRAVIACLAAVIGVGCSGGSSSDEATTLFVDGAAAPGGDGSAESPYQTLGEALEDDRGIRSIDVATGRTSVPASFSFDGTWSIRGSEGTLLETDSGPIAWTGTDGSRTRIETVGFASPFSYQGGTLELVSATVDGVSGPGVSLTDVASTLERLVVTGVTAGDASGDGVVIAGGTVDWREGSVTGAADRALVLSGTSGSLDQLTLQSRTRAPLTANDGTDITVTGATIEQVGVGVSVSGASLVFDGGQVRQAMIAGVLTGPQANLTLINSTFQDNPQGHVALVGSDVVATIRDNVFERSDATCIAASTTQAEVLIDRNRIDGCAGTGISLLDVGAATVSGNEVRNVVPDPIFPEIAEGISIIDAQATISGNTVIDAAANGIAGLRSTIVVSENTVGPVGAAGISLIEQSPNRSTVSDNEVSQATGIGILLIDADADVTGNRVTETVFDLDTFAGEGISFAMGADVSVVGNTTSGNSRNGILFLDGVSGEVRDNTATDNDQYGIREACDLAPNQVTVGTNTLMGNALGDQDLCSP